VVFCRNFLPREELIDAAVRELFKEIGLTLIVDNLTLFYGAHVRDSLHGDKLQHVYEFFTFVPVPYVNAHLGRPAKVEQAVVPHSTIHHDGTCVVSANADIDGLTLTPYVKKNQQK
jgi:ADP-ribose pyrophosphatase YjhB (NUDIX family)